MADVALFDQAAHAVQELVTGEPFARALKVEDVRSDPVLPPEPPPEELAPLKAEPECSFGRGAVCAEVPPGRLLRGEFVEAGRE